jgi:ABC-type bacteriocin/lantibiotic exporter with double-glycine peptidase domain
MMVAPGCSSRILDHMQIPHRHQLNIHYCGPAVLQMTLAAYGIKRTQKQLAKEAKTPFDMKHGTEVKNMAAVLRSYGFAVDEKNNRSLADLTKAYASGKLIIICYTERHWSWDHYAVVKKITANHIYLIDPQEKIGTTLKMPLKEFEAAWLGKIFTHTKKWALFADKPTKAATVLK